MKNSNVSIVPSHKEELIISNPSKRQMEIRLLLDKIDFPAKMKALQETLEDDKVLLEESTGAVSEQKIIQKKKTFFVERIDEKATLSNMIKQNNQNVMSIKNAIARLNVRLYDFIEVIKVISHLENELYSLIEEQSIDANVLKCVLSDIFKEQGLSEEQIYSLLDSSFKRGYILRDRIATLRKDYDNLKNDFEKIQVQDNQLKGEFNEISSKINSIGESIGKVQNELADSTEKLEILDNLSSKVSVLEEGITKKADANELTNLQEQLNKKANANELSSYAKTNDVYTKEEVEKKLTRLWIAYGISTAVLVACLIASFLI